LIQVIAAMDAVIVGACLSAISKSLKSTSVQSFWVGTSFLLAQTVTIPIYGTTGEIFGRKWAIITGIALFLIGSILCATAQNINWLITARVIQGIGAGGITQLVQVILSDITTMEERGLYISMSMASWAFGTNIGVFFSLFFTIFMLT
jgi:MFS family permease